MACYHGGGRIRRDGVVGVVAAPRLKWGYGNKENARRGYVDRLNSGLQEMNTVPDESFLM